MVNVTVTDDKGVAVSCLVTELAAGASLTCSAQGAVQEGPYVNTGTATGDSCGSGTSVLCGGGAGFQATDSDESHYLGEAVKLDTDGDGTPDDVDLDDDNDGQTDSQELTCGSDPLNPDSVFAGPNLCPLTVRFPDARYTQADADDDNLRASQEISH